MTANHRENGPVTPRFEYYPENSSVLRSATVEEYPFTIGRGEGLQLQINSGCVSREHAQLTRTPVGFRLRDLGSTNGTRVNGQPITEVELHDGDSVAIADIELAFVCSAVGRLERMATQPLAGQQEPATAREPCSNVASLRHATEALLWQSVPLAWGSIVSRTTGAEHALTAELAGPVADYVRAQEPADAFSLPARLQQLAWRLAAELAPRRAQSRVLLARVEQPTALDADLCDTLAAAADVLPADHQLGLLLPWEWAVDSPPVMSLCAGLRQEGVCLAFESFTGGARCVDAMESATPDYLIIAENVVRGVSEQHRRLQRLEIVLASCEAAGAQTVAPAGLASDDDYACAQLGLDLVVRSGRSAAQSPDRASAEKVLA